jgi:hypothetical protein
MKTLSLMYLLEIMSTEFNFIIIGRITTLENFIKYVKKFKDIWICKHIDIAKHRIKHYLF